MNEKETKLDLEQEEPEQENCELQDEQIKDVAGGIAPLMRWELK